MFGWKVKVEVNSNSKLIDTLNDLLHKADAAIANPKTFMDFQKGANACNKLVSSLSPTEQSKISLYWTSGVMAQFDILKMYDAMPSMKTTMVKSLMPGIKTHILNTIKELS